MQTFLDADKIECVDVSIAQAEYPHLHWDDVLKRFSWDIKDKVVMAVADLNKAVEAHRDGVSVFSYEFQNNYIKGNICQKN